MNFCKHFYFYTIFCKHAIQTRMMSSIEQSSKYTDYFHEVGYVGYSSTTLIMGAPGKKMLTSCATIFEKASQHRLEIEKENGYLFQYGPSRGDWAYLYNLAKFLSKNYNKDVSMKNLFTTSGASHGLYFTASLFFKKGAPVFVEDPTYFLSFLTLRDDLHLNVVPVCLDSEGINMNELEEKVQKYVTDEKNDSEFNGMMYLIPAHQNPTGLTYSEDRCKEVIKLARKYNLLIICDDVYNLLTYSKPTVFPLFYYDDQSDSEYKGNVISNCTFSKLLGPGLRLGWIQASENIINKFRNSGFIRSGGCPNNYTAGILASVMELGLLDTALMAILKDYNDRLIKVCQILEENLPNGCSFYKPDGGFFVWITLPLEINAEKFAVYFKEHHNVTVLPGNKCSVENNFKNCLRIAFTFNEEKILFNSVLVLCKAIDEYLTMN